MTNKNKSIIIIIERKKKEKKMKTYTEDEIKEWFNEMKKKYPNSGTLEHLEAVEYMMFNKIFDDEDCLKKMKEKGWQIPKV